MTKLRETLLSSAAILANAIADIVETWQGAASADAPTETKADAPGEVQPATRRGRRSSSTDTPAAAANEPKPSAGTEQPAPASTADAGTGAPASADAGTSDPAEYRKAVKAKAAQLVAKPDGEAKLNEMLTRHVPSGQVVKFGNVPDGVVHALEAEIDAALGGGGSALDD